MKVILFFALIGIAFSQEGNIVQVAEKLGATTLLQFATEAGLADTLATGGKSIQIFPFNANNYFKYHNE